MTSHHPTKFSIIGAQISTPNWTGSPITLAWHDSAAMPQTPNGSTVLAWLNTATQNNDGSLIATSGGPPQSLDAPAGATVPSVLVQNWGANALTLTNVSGNQATPIWVEMYGPGIPGVTPVTLTAGSAPISLASAGTATGKSPPNYAQLVMQSNTNNLSIVALIGGPNDPSGNNAYVFALNYQGPANPAGFTKTTSGNTMTFQFYWNTTFFIANMSPSTSAAVNVSLLSL
jgi:hypothetical protein